MSKVSYPTCAHTKREKPDVTANKEIAEEIGRQYRVMPMFEKGLYDHIFIKYYSLQDNEYLKCRWREYVNHFEDRVFAPFQFPDIRDYHFYNCKNRLIPRVSFHRQKEFRFNLKPGPGVDSRGQMPIPYELQMKRGESRYAVKPKRYTQEQREAIIEKERKREIEEKRQKKMMKS